MKVAASTLVCFFIIATWIATSSAEDWTRFRGPSGSGISKTAAPLSWDAEKNIKWKIDLPGPGSSCPIVLDDKVYLSCFTGYGVDEKAPGKASELKRHLLCFDRNTGKELWKSTVDSDNDEDPFEGFITHHGYASSTPVTDGKQLFVHFGKTGLCAFDMKGKPVWKKNVGTKSDPAKWGNGASCVLFKDLVILNAGNTDNAIIALKKSDGTQVWRIDDEGFTNSWSTPIIFKIDSRDEMVINMPGKILAYNPEDGKELWWAKSPIERTVCGSCVYADGVVYAMGGRAGRAIAVKAGGKGDVSESHTVWEKPLRSGINTPIVANGNLYWIATGIAFCASCETGEYHYRERLKEESKAGQTPARGPSGDYASPVAVDGKLIMVTKTGTTHILDASNEFTKAGENNFEGDGGRFNATPAISDGQIFIRSDNKLYCISKL